MFRVYNVVRAAGCWFDNCRRHCLPASVNKTDAVKLALENELRRLDEALPLRERLRPLQDRILARPVTGLEADKAFYDELSGEA